MGKTQNFKSHTWKRDDEMKLKSILKEVHKTQYSQINKIKKYAVIDEVALNGILSSGVLPKSQSKILREYFESKKITRITESVVRRVEMDTKYLTEGIKDWFKKKGEQAMAAFEKGWGAVKGIWKNFTDVVKEFVEKMKQMFKKIKDWVMGKISALASKIAGIVDDKFISKFKEDHPHDHNDLKTEFEQVGKTATHATQFFADKLEKGAAFAKEVLDGSAEPKGVDPLKPEEAEDGAEELQQEARNMYIEIFSNKKNLQELMRLPITESGHLTDKIKNPVIRKVVEYAVFIVKAVLSPASTIVALFIKSYAKNLMQTVSTFVNKALDGPGVFEFAILSLMAAEVFEVIQDLLGAIFHFDLVIDAMKVGFPAIAPFLDGLHLPIHLGHIAVGSYALFTVIYNLSSLFDKHEEEHGGDKGGKEPEVQTAGYKPKGQFKLQEGKLVFVK